MESIKEVRNMYEIKSEYYKTLEETLENFSILPEALKDCEEVLGGAEEGIFSFLTFLIT